MTLAEDHWFVLRNEQQIGPIRFDQLQELARREILHPSDLIWGPGRETWTTAKDIPALFKHTSVASNSAIEPPRFRKPLSILRRCQNSHGFRRRYPRV